MAMKVSRWIMLAVILFFTVETVSAQGTKFQDLTFKAACELAKKENKMVFIDFSMSGCRPCVVMKKDIFPKKSVGDFFNKHFVTLQYNISISSEGRELAMDAGATAYPFFAFYSPETEEPVHMSTGYKKVEDVLKMGKRAITPNQNSVYFVDNYIMGKKDFQFLIDYHVFLVGERDKNKAMEVLNILIEKFGEEKVKAKLATIES